MTDGDPRSLSSVLGGLVAGAPETEQSMIFAFVEGGTVEVLDGPGAATKYEPIDVESFVFVFYDEDGTWLKPRFIKPNRRRFFGFVLEQGSFEVERSADLDPAIDPFSVALSEAVRLEPNKYFSSLEAIRQHVESLQGPVTRSHDG